MVIIRKKKITSVGKDVEKLEILCTAGGNTKWGSHCKTVCSFLKKLNIELPYDLEIPLLGTYPKELKSGY